MIEIRHAEMTDAERLLEIYGYYVRQTAVTFEYDIPTPGEFRERMIRTTARYPWLVILADGKIQGYAYAGTFKDRAAYGWSCETTVYIDRQARKSGLGRKLYEALETELGKMGILNLYACISCPEKEDEYLTADSENFHAHLGYVRVGVFHRCGYKFGRWYNMIWMEKIIGEHRPDQPPVRKPSA